MTDWLVPFRRNVTSMRTRSGLQYRPQRGGTRQWSGPSLSRARMAAQRTFSRSRTMTRNRRQTNGLGITTQHDERRIYRKKSMPRRQRVRWKRFKNKVLAVSEKDLGSRTTLFNAGYSFGNVDPAAHNNFGIALYSNTSTTAYLNDLDTIVNDEVGAWTAATGAVVDKQSKFIFKSAILDLTFRNSSTFTAIATPNPDSSAKLETDVYEILVNGITDDASGTYQTLTALFTSGAADTLTTGGAGTGIAANRRGSSPWDFPAALSKFKIKILKKTKFMTPNGDTFTYQMRDPKRRVATKQSLDVANGCNKQGWTRWIWVISKLVPGLAVGTGAGTYQESLDVGITRKYFYKIEGVSEDRDIFHAV